MAKQVRGESIEESKYAGFCYITQAGVTLGLAKEVHLNLKDVPYMDSSGISIIIESNQRAREKNTKVELKEVSQPVEKVLAMARKFL